MSERRSCLGGTAAGAIYGVDEYRTEHDLWMEAKAPLKPRPPSIEMAIGKACEYGLATAVYPLLTGRNVRFSNEHHIHPTIPGLCATPDAFCVTERRGLEIKTSSYWAKAKWGETFSQIPLSAQLQVAYYTEFFDLPCYDVLALVAGEPFLYTYERDPQWGQAIIQRMREWYTRYIEGDEVPPISGSQSTTDWLAERYPHHRRPDIRPATADELDLLLNFEETKILHKEIKHEEAELANRVRALIGDREGVEWHSGRVTWRKIADKPMTDWHGLSLHLMDRYIPDGQERACLEEQYTRIQKGCRKLVLHSEAYREAAHAA